MLPSKHAFARRNGHSIWLFAGADTGAETLARAMTIIETATMNGIDPQAYLADGSIASTITRSIGSTKLPWNWAPVAVTCAEAA